MLGFISTVYTYIQIIIILGFISTLHTYILIIINTWFYFYFIYILAWEPSAAQVTKSYSSRLPALERDYWETQFSPLKSTNST